MVRRSFIALSLQATAAPATSTGGFGGLGGFSQQQQPQQQQQGAPLVVNTITQHMQAVYNSYDPTSPTCRFQTIFYDRKHPKEVAALQDQAPLHANKRLWTRAQQSNPDPVNLALEQGNSFQDLKSRIQKQDVAAQTLEKHVEANVQALESMQKKHEDMRTTIVAMREEHATLTFRLLQMVTNIEMERARGQTLTEPELEYHKKLQHLMRMLDQPGKFKSKVHELDSLIGRLQNGRGTEQPFLSAESLGPAAGQLLEVLRVQKESLAYLTATLRKDFADASAVVNQLEYQARSLQPRLPAPDGANGNAAMRY
jgi:nuclear pore complex protein Nup54